MSNAKALKQKTFPKALACGMLQDSGRILFLVRTEHGMERIELPCTEIYPGEDPVSKLAAEFRRQTSIDAEVSEIKTEKRYNAGSRKRKHWIPCIVFSMRAKSRKTNPSAEFSGFRWLGLDEAKKMKLGRKAEWI